MPRTFDAFFERRCCYLMRQFINGADSSSVAFGSARDNEYDG
ncbi:hypothetical protein JCM19239_4517 [Vibrio variabilis]|uniref:Uncharacterized protein n=1 Tax=Vibrio variabilis TaxID=990271 RepID=A0ABQ0J7P7_9VIBR|nr:hypothetical protein JCM19239_4517 [Vibrio variabilis]